MPSRLVVLGSSRVNGEQVEQLRRTVRAVSPISSLADLLWSRGRRRHRGGTLYSPAPARSEGMPHKGKFAMQFVSPTKFLDVGHLLRRGEVVPPAGVEKFFGSGRSPVAETSRASCKPVRMEQGGF